MKKLKYSKTEAFVFKLWDREVSGDKISEKELEVLELWKREASKKLDKGDIQESKVKVLAGLESYFTHPAGSNMSYLRKNFYHAAAVLLIIFGLTSFFTFNFFFKPDVYVAENINHIIKLEDGSVVMLLPSSKLTVEKSFPAKTRIVDLQGDAVFKVAKSKTHPFIVRAEGFSTRVMGTVFKVMQRGKRKTVELYEGKVAVSSPGTAVSYLTPNQRWTNLGLPHTAAVAGNKTDEKSGKKISVLMTLTFSDVSFRSIMEVLHKNYGINIKYPEEIADKKITADLTGSSWDENVEALAFITGLEVQKENNTTYILKK
ncbi:transmembrane sensor [Chryseobacterium sp. H1D6B]|uniref:FecR family protein n=1 Tax=Chryseobacterium sp. H1D6B TaxID=2940588 RepID=UPI0017FE0CA8|nr:FecR family protein [Chryseobacterium sp. H1D6B]MDH6250605.1 transmembrane sensor [Chryseobacterium sp. H1D6B]